MIILSLLIASSLHADPVDYLFTPPPPAITKTKYASDCGGSFPDLEKEMPPVDFQMAAPWCATFTAKALLENFYHQRFSAFDLNSASPFGPKETIGIVPDFEANLQPDPVAYLEGVQASGKIYLDADLPFDQSFFDKNGTIGKLSAYYDRQKDFAGRPELRECRDQSAVSLGLEKEFSELAEVLAVSLSKEQFLANVGKGRLILPLARTGSQRVPLEPSFNIRSFIPQTGDQLVEEIQSNLANRRPISVSICANQMLQLPGLGNNVNSMSEAEKKNCGAHALVVIGLERIEGECRIKVRNSWGRNWPEAGAGGNAWLPLKDFLRISQVNPLYSLRERKAGAPIENRVPLRDDSTYVGETRRWRSHGHGKLSSVGQTEEGTFVNGQFTEGKLTTAAGDTYSGKFVQGLFTEGTMKGGLSNGSKYEGQFKDSQLNGTGKLTGPDGSISTGQFENGFFVQGTFKGKFNDGAFYEGGIKNARPEGKGKFVAKDGSVREGVFKDGKFSAGRYKGLIDAAKGMYYDGPMKDGITMDPTKFTDKDGNPWTKF